ncbi:MAG: tryptophan synthase subunit alpha [Planctomycetes bacterium]|nr:tryptophan synthase subunit alpha [Planctomycetota bacterium]
MKNRLAEVFKQATASGRKTLVPFITAGYPDAATTGALLTELERIGVRVCELGVPFSDPIADGPVIQASYTDALASGFKTGQAFEIARRYRNRGGRMALVMMVSYSLVFKQGPGKFLARAAGAGFDGLIVPDLPLEEAGRFEAMAARAGLANVMLIAPTSPLARRIRIAGHSRGFIYYMSVAGITGERVSLPKTTIRAVAELRRKIRLPVCLGFGISSPRTVRLACSAADGAIVGSAIVRRIADCVQSGASGKKLVASVGRFVGGLLKAAKSSR